MNGQIYDKLNRKQKGTFLSLYIPTEVTGDYQKSRIAFKNAVEEARSLIESKLPDINPYKYLSSALEFLDDDDFWANQSTTLGYFSDGKEGHFAHLPVSTESFVHLGERYITYPFMQVLNDRQRYFVLYLDLNGVKFFEGNAYSITPVVISDVAPTRLSDIKMMYSKNDDLQHNPNNPSYHGHDDNDKEAFRDEFFRTLDKGLMRFLHDESCPMLLVGLKENIQHYRSISKYSNIISEEIIGYMDPLKLDDLQAKTWPIIKSFVSKDKLDKETIGNLDSKKMIVREIEGIKSKLQQGQVEQLVFPRSSHPSMKELEPHELEDLCLKAQNTSAEISWNTPAAEQIMGVLRYTS